MSLIHYVKPFLDLGICKEYSMARKTTGNVASTRGKKMGAIVPPAELQSSAGVSAEASEASNEAVQDMRNGKSAAPVPINQRTMNQHSVTQNSPGQNSLNQNSPNQSSPNQSSINPELEEEIRHRAYELFLQRQAKGEDVSGDPHRDWLTAEREILARNGRQGRKSA
jgi:hypothetical protein